MPYSRISIVGLGEAGYEMHMPALAKMRGIEVVGACDVDAARRQRIKEKWNPPLFDNYESMLDQARPDAVIIATPPDSHAQLCLTAIERGIDIICEKPFVSSLREADEVMSAASSARKQIALNHEFREMPIFRALLDSAGPGSGEEVFFAQVWQNTDVAPWTEAGWRGQMQRRTLHEAGVHLVDYILALFGEKPLGAWASMSSGGVFESGADALSVVSLEFTRGRIAQILQNRLCKGETQYFEVRADTRTSSYRASFGGRARVTAGLYRSTSPHLRFDYGISGLAWKEQGNARKLLARNPADPRVVATQYVLEKSLAAFAAGKKPPASTQDARDALEVIDACYSAAVTGRRTPIGQLDSVSQSESVISATVS
ncbi:MAG: Gfo/Idh/MocA family protein [Gemmatimonadaceae bacterium]